MAGRKITGRTKQLSLKATPQFHQSLKVLSSKDNLLMIEVLEEALNLYEQARKERKKSVKEISKDRIDKRPLLNEETEVSSKKKKDWRLNWLLNLG